MNKIKILNLIHDYSNDKNNHKFNEIEKGINFIENNVKHIFENNNKEVVLCVGQVQSGKTANIIESTKYAIENNYKLIIIYGGTTNILLSQTIFRFENNIESKNKIKIVTSRNDFHNITDYLTRYQSVIVICLKEKQNLEKLFDNFNYIDNFQNINVLIVDDECDYASVNSSKSSLENESKIYKLISDFYSRFHNGKMLNFTATPFANIMSNKSNQIKPDRIVVLNHYDKYCGIDVFEESNCYLVTNLNKDKNKFVHYSVLIWIILTSILKIEKPEKKSELLINVKYENEEHLLILKDLIDYLNVLLWHDINDDELLKRKLIELNFQEYSNRLNEIKNMAKNILKHLLLDITKNVYVLNSQFEKQYNPKNEFQIIISGFMASRGFTFENLICELFLNNSENQIAIDTLLQKCRWFGNRNETMRYIKIIINQQIRDSLIAAKKYVDLFKPGHSIKNEQISCITNDIANLDELNRHSLKFKGVVSTNERKKV